jgi:RNA polymerase sigma factor (sigma-70 family)
MGTDDSDSWVSQVHRSYGAELKRFLTRRLRDRAAAEDVAQETYLHLHRLEQAQVRHPRALLFVIASHLAARYRKRGEIHGADDSAEAAAVPDSALSPERIAELDDAIRVLEEIVEAMPDQLRMVWVLRRVEDLSPAQIAEQLGLSVKAVNRRLERAMVYCREGLLKRGIDRLGA